MDSLDAVIECLNRIESRQIKNNSPWFDVSNASEYLKVSDRSIRRYISKGKIKSYQTPTGGVRLHQSDLDSFVMYGKPYKKLTRPQKESIKETRDV